MQDHTGRAGAGQRATPTGETKPHRPVSLQGRRMSSYVQTTPLNCIGHRLGGQLVERNSLCGQECALLLIRRAVLQWIGTLHESFVGLVVVSERRRLSLDCEIFEGLRAFAYGITVRIAHKCKSVLPGGKAVNSGQNVVKNAKRR